MLLRGWPRAPPAAGRLKADRLGADGACLRTSTFATDARIPATGVAALANDSLRASIGWTITVLAWVAVCWAATTRQARGGRVSVPAVVGGIAPVTQCALAFVPPTRWVAPVSWPGPAQPFD